MHQESGSAIRQEVLDANAAYAAQFGDKKDLALPPARGFAILTCMDARLDPAKYAGFSEGDAHVIRNAGGRATDDIRSLVISHKLLGTREWFVIHHTDCGMQLFSDEVMGELLEDNLETASFDGKKWSTEARPRVLAWTFHQMGDVLRQRGERKARRAPYSRASAGSSAHSNLWLYL
jgi:carbonic anhydrase